jgi:SAM-dependent methyltransferase
MSDRFYYPCGCINVVHEPSGVTRCFRKCPRHQAMARRPETLDEAYYTELGVLKDGKIVTDHYVRQLTEALGPIPLSASSPSHDTLEIGCGISPYVKEIRKAGWLYEGLDASELARNWMHMNYVRSSYVWFTHSTFEDLKKWTQCGFILAAHVFEHMDDAPGAIAKCYDLLEPGGWLWVIVPDDNDPTNPDHQWFFTEQTLRRCLEAGGFTVERLVMRKYIERENFLYCAARKV